MSLDILEHPTIERLIMGEAIRVQELREALVEFWEKNNTFSLCGDCPMQWRASVVGCCGSCIYHDVTKGCTLRNVSCLTFTCNFLEAKLRQQGTWASYEWFRKLLWGGSVMSQEPFCNSLRLPDDAEMHMEEREDRHRKTKYYKINLVDSELRGESPPHHKELSRDRKRVEDKIGEAGISCRVSEDLYRLIKKKYPDAPVYVDNEAHQRARIELGRA